MGFPSWDLKLLYYAELFWEWGLLFGISQSSLSSWNIELHTISTQWLWVESHIVSFWWNRARVIVGSRSALGFNSLFVVTLLQSQLGPQPHICRRVRRGFPQLLIWQWSCKPTSGSLSTHLPFRSSSFVFRLCLIVIFTASTCPLAWGRATKVNTFLIYRSS